MTRNLGSLVNSLCPCTRLFPALMQAQISPLSPSRVWIHTINWRSRPMESSREFYWQTTRLISYSLQSEAALCSFSSSSAVWVDGTINTAWRLVWAKSFTKRRAMCLSPLGFAATSTSLSAVTRWWKKLSQTWMPSVQSREWITFTTCQQLDSGLCKKRTLPSCT